MLPSVDGAPAVLRGCGDGFAGAGREESRGVSGPRARLLSASQVPDPERAVRSTDGRIAHCSRPRPRLPGPVSGAAFT